MRHREEAPQITRQRERHRTGKRRRRRKKKGKVTEETEGKKRRQRGRDGGRDTGGNREKWGAVGQCTVHPYTPTQGTGTMRPRT